MKKTYQKPKLVKAGELATATAIACRVISGYEVCGVLEAE